MAMTAKDFEVIAKAIAETYDGDHVTTTESMRKIVGEAVMNACASTYKGAYSFNYDKFREVARI